MSMEGPYVVIVGNVVTTTFYYPVKCRPGHRRLAPMFKKRQDGRFSQL